MIRLSALFSAVALVSLAAVSSADVTFGGSRAAGMGGAGLALPIDVFQNTRLNPAMQAFGPKRFTLQYPQVGYRNDGIDLEDVADLADFNGSGNEDLVVRIAREYGDRRRVIGVDAGLGFFAAGFSLTLNGEASITSVPNQTLRDFINSGADPDQAPLDAQLDAYGFGYYSVGVGYANAFQLPSSKLGAGLRVKSVRGYYAHKKAFGPSISGNTTGGVVNGSGIPGSEDYLDQSALGVDLGLIYQTDRIKDTYFGLTVENAIQPNIKFDRERPNNGTLDQDFVDPFRRTFNLGVGYAYRQNILFAADLVDLGNNAGRSEFRTGVELGVSRQFAARAGYNTRTGFTYGVALGGFNIQLGGQRPVTIGTSVRF